MRYLTGVVNPGTAAAAAKRDDLGIMLHPANSTYRHIPSYPFFGADNGGFGGKFNPNEWLPYLDLIAPWQERCLFAVVPDRFLPDDLDGNHKATLEMWHEWHHEVTDRGLPAAFVCQNGSTPDDVPTTAAAVFVGGSTEWKLSHWAIAHIAAAKARGCHAHVGRVNSEKRTRSVSIMGADSIDGTFLKHGPDVLLPKLLSWLDGLNERPHLNLFGAHDG